MRQPGSIRAEAEARGVSVARVQRERARARTEDPQRGSPAIELVGHVQDPSIDPEQARQVHFLGRVLGLTPSAIAGHLGITEGAVVRALATDAPALRLSTP